MATEEQKIAILECYDATKTVKVDLGQGQVFWPTERVMRSIQMVVLESDLPHGTKAMCDKLISDFIAKSFYPADGSCG